jgi:hypothetical protein
VCSPARQRQLPSNSLVAVHDLAAAERHAGPEPEQRPDPVLPAGPLKPGEGQDEALVLLALASPQRLEGGGDAELREPLQVGRADELQVRDVMPAVDPLRLGQARERVERGTRRAVARRVEMQLKAEVGQCGGVRILPLTRTSSAPLPPIVMHRDVSGTAAAGR